MKKYNVEDVKFDNNKLIVFISGVSGQDGSYMADYLLKNTDYNIVGGIRRLSVDNFENIQHLEGNNRFFLVNFDLTDSHSIFNVVNTLKPSYFINFAAQSDVKKSWELPLTTWETNTTPVLNILEAIRNTCPNCRFFNAGSSEEFGNVDYSPQDEKHPARPRSPYGASKVAARQLVKVYRESYGLYAVQGWSFNHESPRRSIDFVTRKITKGVARIKKAIDIFKKGVEGIAPRELIFDPIELGNLNARRDWSDAEDVVDAVWRMLNQDYYSCDNSVKDFSYLIDKKYIGKYIKEYVVSSDVNHSIREFVELAFEAADINGMWFINKNDDPLSERYTLINDDGIIVPDCVLVKINPTFYRPAEVDNLLGNSSLIRKELGWKPKTSFEELVKKMVESDKII
jgi:GDPmannose 4,6-dehydratase